MGKNKYYGRCICIKEVLGLVNTICDFLFGKWDDAFIFVVREDIDNYRLNALIKLEKYLEKPENANAYLSHIKDILGNADFTGIYPGEDYEGLLSIVNGCGGWQKLGCNNGIQFGDYFLDWSINFYVKICTLNTVLKIKRPS